MPMLFTCDDQFVPSKAGDVLTALRGLDEESLACTILIAALDAEDEMELN
jgi:hypothetical protein